MVMVNLPTAGVDYHVPFGGRKGSSYGCARTGTVCLGVLHHREDVLHAELNACAASAAPLPDTIDPGFVPAGTRPRVGACPPGAAPCGQETSPRFPEATRCPSTCNDAACWPPRRRLPSPCPTPREPPESPSPWARSARSPACRRPTRTELNQGVNAAFAQVNAAGGCRRPPARAASLDDGYKEDGFVRSLRRRDETPPRRAAVAGGRTLHPAHAGRQAAGSERRAGAECDPWRREPAQPGPPRLFHIRAGDRQQVERIIRHAVTLGMTQIAVLSRTFPSAVWPGRRTEGVRRPGA
jgi:hypothetical protein